MDQDASGLAPMREGECPFCERIVLVYQEPPRCPFCSCPISEDRMDQERWQGGRQV